MRAFYGALVGAFAVLLIHPTSRPHFVQGLWFIPKKSLSLQKIPAKQLQHAQLTLLEHSSIVRFGLGKELIGDLTESECKNYLLHIRSAANIDPDNAFWRQSEAVFRATGGDIIGARKSLSTASFATRWNDYSVDEITDTVNSIFSEESRELAWTSALSESLKSSTCEQTITGLARKILRDTSESDLETRVLLFRNGRLLRDGSRSAEGSFMGLELMELTAFGPGGYEASPDFPGMFVSPKTQTTARARLFALATKKSPTLGEEIADGFRRNDAWTAFIEYEDISTTTLVLTAISVITSSLPGVLVSIGLIGAVIVGVGIILRSSTMARKLLTQPWSQMFAIIAGVSVYLITGLIFPAIWATVAFASFGVRQDKNREGVPTGYGGAYSIAIVVLSICFSIIMSLYFIAISPAGVYLGEIIGFENSVTGSEFALVGLSAIILSVALITGSVWGFLLRVPSEKLASVSLMRFGTNVCLGCFAAGILLAPPAIAGDKIVRDRIHKIFQNEPNYYLTK